MKVSEIRGLDNIQPVLPSDVPRLKSGMYVHSDPDGNIVGIGIACDLRNQLGGPVTDSMARRGLVHLRVVPYSKEFTPGIAKQFVKAVRQRMTGRKCLQ